MITENHVSTEHGQPQCATELHAGYSRPDRGSLQSCETQLATQSIIESGNACEDNGYLSVLDVCNDVGIARALKYLLLPDRIVVDEVLPAVLPKCFL